MIDGGVSLGRWEGVEKYNLISLASFLNLYGIMLS